MTIVACLLHQGALLPDELPQLSLNRRQFTLVALPASLIDDFHFLLEPHTSAVLSDSLLAVRALVEGESVEIRHIDDQRVCYRIRQQFFLLASLLSLKCLRELVPLPMRREVLQHTLVAR